MPQKDTLGLVPIVGTGTERDPVRLGIHTYAY